MANAKHTPGPWKYVGRAKAVRHSFAVEAGVWTFYAGSEANARLIAAAPEMLGILKELSAITRAYIAEGIHPVDSAIADAEVIIAKAEGR